MKKRNGHKQNEGSRKSNRGINLNQQRRRWRMIQTVRRHKVKKMYRRLTLMCERNLKRIRVVSN